MRQNMRSLYILTSCCGDFHHELKVRVRTIPGRLLAFAVLLFMMMNLTPCLAGESNEESCRKVVDASVLPLMKKHGIPGMSVGITVGGKSYIFNYGVASRSTKKSITDHSIFEIGSISKTMTATLASLALVEGKFSLADKVSVFLPALSGTEFGDLTLLNLGTHTSGGLPLQLPESVTTNEKLMQYLQSWKPKHKPGTVRNYANPGIGMLGYITAKVLKQSFDELMPTALFKPLGMKESYLQIPDSASEFYAQGYTEKDVPVRMKKAVLASEAYGVRTTASDLLHFLRCNMGDGLADGNLRRAIEGTHTGYFKARAMTQDLIWEQYPLPVSEKDLLDGSSHAMIFESPAVTKITPPEKPRTDVWIHKTGSTAGFAAYAAFIPREKLGLVLLANKTYPIEDRILAARAIFKSLGGTF